MTITADFSGAIKKTATLLNLDKATKRNLTDWASETVKALKMSAKGRSYRFTSERRGGGATGALARSIGFKVTMDGETYKLTIGTGLGQAEANRAAVKYALIQNYGGTTHPTVTKRMRGWAWWMFHKTGEDKYRGIALTKKEKLTVRIPGSAWFSSVWEHRMAFLNQNFMNDDAILRTAEKLSGGGHAD